MTKQFPTIKLDNGVSVTYKVIANFRDTKISIYKKYENAPFSKFYISTSFLEREDIIKIMFEYDVRDLMSFILKENLTCGKIKNYFNGK